MSNGITKRQREAAIFGAFLAAEPAFAGEPVSRWSQPDLDPPDILCTTSNGRSIGVELKTWVNEDQVSQAKGHEARQEEIRTALDPQPANTSAHIAFVWLTLTDRRLPAADAAAFRGELLGLLGEAEAAWPVDGSWDGLQGHWYTAFPGRPTLASHVSTVKLFPRAHFDPRGEDSAHEWIIFPFRASAYSEREMMNPLEDLLANAWTKYGPTRRDKGLDELHLLIHYDDLAWANCTPVETPDFSFEETAKQVRAFLQDYKLLGQVLEGEDRPPFDRVFLFIALEGIARQRVFRLL